VRPSDRLSGVAAVSFAGASAALAARLLAPARPAPRPDPVRPEEYFSAAEITAGRRYGASQRRLAGARTATELTVLIGLVRRCPPPGAGGPSTGALTEAVGTGAAAAGLGCALALLTLPIDVLSRRRSLAEGLATDSWRAWGVDRLKAQAIEALLTGSVAAGSTLLARRSPQRWWGGAAAGIVAIAGIFGVLAPVLLEPLFNDFTPLPEGEVRRDVLALAKAAGVDVGEVYSVDASRRTTTANAYVSGLGPTKRVVLFDTLLADFQREEVRFVVAHELGHVRHRDVWRQLAFILLSAPGAAYAVQVLATGWAGGMRGPRALPALSLAAAVAGLPLGVCAATLSRAVERRTDAFGLALTGAPEGLIDCFRRLAVQSRADVTAGRHLRDLWATHPPLLERIGTARAHQRLRPGLRTPAGS
jgi:STE24 endopeptidase